MKSVVGPSLPNSAAAFARASRVIPGGMSRFLPMSNPDPVFLERGQGAYVFDIDGHRYLDFNNNFTSLIHGHAHPAVVEAVCRAAANGASFGSPTLHEPRLAEALIERIPGIHSVRFQNTGTEAAIVAIKAARAFTGRPMIAKLEGAYHGFGEYAEVSQEFSALDGGAPTAPSSTAPSAGTPKHVTDAVVVLPMNDDNAAAELIRANSHALAAVLIDAMPGRAGMIRMTRSFAEMLRAECSRHGILLIDDEVMSLRVGRTGALDPLGVRADLVVLGKIIGGGLPIGAVAGPRDIMEVFRHARGGGRVTSSGTYSANPVSLAAGLAALDALTDDENEKAMGLAARLREAGGAVLGEHGLWPCVNGAGSLFRFVLKEAPIVTPRDSLMTSREQRMQKVFAAAMLNRRVWLTASGTGCVSTVMELEHIDQFVECARAAVGEAVSAVDNA